MKTSLAMAVMVGAVAASVMPPGWASGPPGLAPTSSCHSAQFTALSTVTVLRDCQLAPQLIPLRGGSYRMGDQVGDGQPYELPVHVVQVAAFALGRFEVTQAEWRACVDGGGCADAGDTADAHRGSYPIEGISWNQAKGYVDWLGKLSGKPYRLPSEAEWEYAARAGVTGRYPWASNESACKHANLLDVSGHLEHQGWYWFEQCNDQFASSAPVGSFPPNAWGLHDMLGNVWEWVADCWHSDYSGAPDTSAAWIDESCRKHVNRGGGWGNNLRSMRLSNRDGDPATAHGAGLGFRVARDLSADEVRRFSGAVPDAVAPAEVASAPSVPSAPVQKVPQDAPLPPPVLTLARERAFELRLSIHGQQSWTKPPQHGDGVTEQEVVLSTRLRSDGVLYRDNLVDPDPAVRFAVKQQYQQRQGLLRIMALNGDRLPATAEEVSRLADQIQAGLPNCLVSLECAGDAVYRAAGLEALRNNPVRDLQAMVGPPATGAAARWLYYFGYAGCPTTIHITSHTHVTGERSIFVGGSRMVPWEVDSHADGQGSEEDRQQLCTRFVVTANVRTGEVYLENLYVPSTAGVTISSRGSKERRSDDNLTIPSAVLTWANEKLRKTVESAEFADSLPATAPFDENYTILGHFDGHIKTKMHWSFKPAEVNENPAQVY